MPSEKPKVVKTITSGAPEIYPDVDIYDETLEHVHRDHFEVFEKIDEVYDTIASPDRIHKSMTNPRSVLLVSDTHTSPGGSPLRVPVKVVSDTEAIMTSAYFSSSSGEGELLYSKKKS